MAPDAGGFTSFLESIKPLLPIPVLLVLLPALWWFFRDTWRELDEDALAWRAKLKLDGKSDLRPFVALAMCAVILTLQEYYCGRSSFEVSPRPWPPRRASRHPATLDLA